MVTCLRHIAGKLIVVAAVAVALAFAACAGDGAGDTASGITRNSSGPPEFEAPPHPRGADNTGTGANGNGNGNGDGANGNGNAPNINAPNAVNRSVRRERPIPTVHAEAWEALRLYAPLTELREPTLANPVEVARRFLEAIHVRDDAVLRSVLHPQSPFPLPTGDPAAAPTSPEQRRVVARWNWFWTWHAAWIGTAFGVQRWGDAQIIGRQAAAIAMVIEGAPDDQLVTVITLGYWERVLDAAGAVRAPDANASNNNAAILPGGEMQTRVGQWGIWGYRQEPRREASELVRNAVVSIDLATDRTFPGVLMSQPALVEPDETVEDALSVLLELNRQNRPLDVRILADDRDGERPGDPMWPPQLVPPEGWPRALARRVRQAFDEAPAIATATTLRTIAQPDGAAMTRYVRVELRTRDGYPRIATAALRSLLLQSETDDEVVVATPWMLVDWVRQPMPTVREDDETPAPDR